MISDEEDEGIYPRGSGKLQEDKSLLNLLFTQDNMTEENKGSEGHHLTKGRLEALSDGIFAFAMTLLVIGLNLPDKATLVQSNAFALQVLLSLYSRGILAQPASAVPSRAGS
jgi:hypothetical protein